MFTYITAMRQSEAQYRTVLLGPSGGAAQRRSVSRVELQASPQSRWTAENRRASATAYEDSATELTATEPRAVHVGFAVSSLRTASGALRNHRDSDPDASPPIQLHDEMPSWETSTSKVYRKIEVRWIALMAGQHAAHSFKSPGQHLHGTSPLDCTQQRFDCIAPEIMYF